MTDHIEMPDDYVGKAEDWPHFKAGAAKVADLRLSELQRMIGSAVDHEFKDWALNDVLPQFDGVAEAGIGGTLFSALTSVLIAWIPDPIVGAAISSFRDVLVAGIQAGESAAVSDVSSDAKAQLRHVVLELASTTISAAESASAQAKYSIDDDLDALFESDRVRYGSLVYDDTAKWWEEQICDAIGIFDPLLYSPSGEIVSCLWAEFNHVLGQASLQVKWAQMGEFEKVMYLAEHWDDFDRIVAALGGDPAWWRERVERYLNGDG